MLAAVAIAGAMLIITLTVGRRNKGLESGDGLSNPSLVEKWKPRLKKSLGRVIHNNDEKASASKRVNHANKELDVDPKDTRGLYRYKFSKSELGYDIYNCPPTPPDGYPRAWPITDIISNWNPNDVTTISPSYREVHHSLCIFDYQTQYEAALAYRDAEKPFVSSRLNKLCLIPIYYLSHSLFVYLYPRL
jgi:hypothetical protein